MNYFKIEPCSVSNGVGFRVILWVSGCGHHCKGCQNKQTWDPKCGKEFTSKVFERLITELKKPYIQGLTLTGGDPLFKDNQETIFRIIEYINKHLPEKDIWLYTGDNIVIEDFFKNDLKAKIISLCDVVVDGEYEEEQRDLSLAFKGSKNQKIINIKATRENEALTTVEL